MKGLISYCEKNNKLVSLVGSNNGCVNVVLGGGTNSMIDCFVYLSVWSVVSQYWLQPPTIVLLATIQQNKPCTHVERNCKRITKQSISQSVNALIHSFMANSVQLENRSRSRGQTLAVCKGHHTKTLPDYRLDYRQ